MIEPKEKLFVKYQKNSDRLIEPSMAYDESMYLILMKNHKKP